MIQKLTCLAMVVLLFACASSAQAEGFYVGASFVQSDAEFEDAANNFEADDSSFKIFAGYDFLKWLGVEASYRDFGNFKDNSGSITVDADLEGLDLEARGKLPIGKIFAIFAKVGYANVQYDVDFSTVGSDFDDDEWELMYGAGLDVYLGKRFGLRAEWEEFDVEDSLNSLSAGAFFRF